MMATDLEDALLILENARSDKVRLTRFPDGRIQIEIAPHSEKAAVQSRQGKWARIADDLARENLFGQGLGDKVRASMREFRDGFKFRDGFSKTGER